MSSKTRIETIAQTRVQKSGLKSLSFRTLGAEVGVRSSSVHYHFPEKSDLAEALIKRFRNDIATFLSDITKNNSTPYVSIQQFCRLFMEQNNQGNICLAGMLAAEVESLSEGNRELLNAVFDDIRTWLIDVLNQAKDELTINLPTSTLADVLLSALEGALLIDRARNSEHNLNAVNVLIDSWFSKLN